MQAEQRVPTKCKTTLVSLCVFCALLVSAMMLLAPSPTISVPDATGGAGFAEFSPAGILNRRLQQIESVGGDPEQSLVLHTSAGHVYRDQGHFSEAIKHYEAARDLASQLGGGPRLVPVLEALGLARLRQGRLPEARQDLEAALVLVGANQDQKAGVLQALGNIRRDMGHIDEALKLYQQAWQEVSATAQRPSLAADFGDAYLRRGDVDKAESYIRHALKQQEAASQRLRQPWLADDLDAALAYSLLGGAYHSRGSVSQAMGFYKKALRAQAKVLRPGHTDLVATQIGVAIAQRDLGDVGASLDTIEGVFLTLLAGNQEGPDLSRVLLVKADLLREARRYLESELTINMALALQIKCFGGEIHPEVAGAHSGYGRLMHDQGKFDHAIQEYNKALEVYLRTVGLQHPETAFTHNSLGIVYMDAGNNDEAVSHFTKSLEIQGNIGGGKSLDMGITCSNLATVHYRRGSLQEAAQAYRQALQIMDVAGVPKAEPDRVVCVENLAHILKRLRNESSPPEALGEATERAPAVVSV